MENLKQHTQFLEEAEDLLELINLADACHMMTVAGSALAPYVMSCMASMYSELSGRPAVDVLAGVMASIGAQLSTGYAARAVETSHERVLEVVR
jgi:hypothetical protein